MNLVAKIVFFTETPFSERHYNRYGIEVLQKNGFDVEVWDFTPFLRPQIHRDVKVSDPIQFTGHKQFPNRQGALKAISELGPDCFVVTLIAYQHGSIGIYRKLSSARVGYGVVVTNALPVMSAVKDPKAMIVQIRRSSSAQLLKALTSRIPFQCLGIGPATVVLAGGEQSLRYAASRPVSEKTKILWAHTRDYDLYMYEQGKPVRSDMKTGVFLDEYLPFHPDYDHMGMKPPSTPEEYFPSLCRFFDSLERDHGVRIDIAAHPRSRYGAHPDYFGGRAVLGGRTIDLVRQAGFVIAHSSTALNFAVLLNKPVLLVITDKLLQSPRESRAIQGMAVWLNKTPINVDAPLQLDWEKELTVDLDAYARYREAYIKRKDSPEKNTWQILADYLKASEA
jgi:hypothetical protein